MEEEDELYTYRIIFYHILGPIVTSLGIIGNILCLLAIWYRNFRAKKDESSSACGMRGYMYTFICALAFADLGFLAFTAQGWYYASSQERFEDNFEILTFVVLPIVNSFKATSDFIVIWMTIDRVRIIGNIAGLRLQALRKEETKEKQWIVYVQIFLATLFSFAMHVPFYFGIGHNLDGNCTRLNRTILIDTDKDEGFQDLYSIYLVTFVTSVKVVPVFVIVILNVVLVKRLRIIWRRRRKIEKQNAIHPTVTLSMSVEEMTSKRRKAWSAVNKKSIREQRLASLLVIIAICFLVLTLPANIVFLLYDIAEIPCLCKGVLVIITNFFESINYSINFYVYCLVHQEIRHSFFDLCRAAVSICCVKFKN